MGDRGVRRQNRGFHWRAIAIGEDPMQRNLDNVSVIQLNFVVAQGIEEAVERFLQLGFEVSDNADDLVERLLVQHTARSVDEQTNVFVKLNVIRKRYHRLSQRPDLVTNFSSLVSRSESRILGRTPILGSVIFI